jgi:D-alanyl-D-alanine endopeptidase (penicillin-binding protein 7)
MTSILAFRSRAFLMNLPLLSAYAFCLAAASPARAIPDVTRDGLPNIQSSSAFVMDWTSGAVLFERDIDVIRPLASLSKLVGAMVIQEQCNLDPEGLHMMSISNREAAKGGDKSKLTTGWQFSHADLLHAALMRSDNRALPALAEACGMSAAQLGDRMTKKVRDMGLTMTTFVEPNGLSPMNVSTARELMVILKQAVKLQALAAIMSTSNYEITAIRGSQRQRIKIRNTDRLLTKNLAEIIGGKTGYTDLARYCLAVAARLPDQRELGMVFLGAEGRYTRFADFTRVLKWLRMEPKIVRQDQNPVMVVPSANN